ncbi:hypothetical protein [Sphingomonas sp. AX6]|uniref:hypothetical protein n=1 Tax=Sphingomonas sp. AX6 TaxID=2653171 RepID=UPI0012F2AE86|nr:hypothetical protein [Sphingomonas sp. AX6]VXC43623.1 conserved hypothetical protein [Sphingomonas sp. AX6]
MALGFKGMGWFLCGLVVAPGCYVVMSQVAAERARVESVDRAIRQAKRDIRNLETEFKTRANFAQLERWNGEVFALGAPQPEQFAGDIAELAARGMGEGDAGMRYASYVVPTMTAEIDDAVRGGIQRAQIAEREASQSPAPVQTASVAAATPARQLSDATPKAAAPKQQAAKPTRVAAAPATKPVRTASAPAAKPAPRQQRRAEVASLDRKLLSDSTMGDLMKAARTEARPRN